MHQTYTALKSLETGMSLAAARGNGRLATIFGMSRSIGSGFRVTARAIEQMLLLPKADLIVDKRTGAVYPTGTHAIDASITVFKRLEAFLKERENKLQEEGLDELEVKETWLGHWTTETIIDNTIEYMARAFAWRVGEPERKAIVFGDKSESSAAFKAAIRTLPFAQDDSLWLSAN
jgi:hypothetical protein